MSSELEEFRHLKDLKAQAKAAEFSREISDSLILQYNWGDLLSAAPLALKYVGLCQLIASAPAAAGIKLKCPSRGFEHLRYTSLQANLMLLADTGRSAFLEAERQMEVLRGNSRYIFSETGPLNKIIDALSDDKSAKRTLPRYMDTLTRRVKECETSLEKMDAKFEKWLHIAEELSQVATESEHDTSSKKYESNERILAQEAWNKVAEEEKKRREEAVEEAKRRMTMAEEAFKLASKNIPSGWNAIGMNIVDGLSQSVLAIGSALVTAFSPSKYVALGHAVLSVVKSTASRSERLEPEQEDFGELNATGEDPGLGQVENLMKILSALLNLTKGTTENRQDLDQFQSGGPDSKSTLFHVRAGLESSQGQLKRNAAPGTFSADLEMIIGETLKVVEELVQEMKDQREISVTPRFVPVGNWSEAVSRLHNRVLAIKARKDSLPGFAMGTKSPSPNTKGGKSKYATGRSVAQSYLASTTAIYEARAKNLHTQRQILDASTEKLMDNLSKISEIQHSISRLSTENMTFGKIICILRESIQALSNLKEEISSLLRFFKGISAMVDLAARGPCESLLETLDLGLESDDPGVVDGMTYRDFQKQLLMNTIFMIRGYFDVVSEVSRLYVEISREHIMPGVNLIAKLGLTQASNDSENAETVPRNEMLEKYTAGAVSEIKKLAEDRRRLLRERTAQRLLQIQQEASQLPPKPQKKPIEDRLSSEAATTIQDQPSYINETETLLIGVLDEDL